MLERRRRRKKEKKRSGEKNGRKEGSFSYGRSTRTVTNLHQGELNKKGMKTNDKKGSSVTQVRGTNNTINYFFQVRLLGIPDMG